MMRWREHSSWRTAVLTKTKVLMKVGMTNNGSSRLLSHLPPAFVSNVFHLVLHSHTFHTSEKPQRNFRTSANHLLVIGSLKCRWSWNFLISAHITRCAWKCGEMQEQIFVRKVWGCCQMPFSENLFVTLTENDTEVSTVEAVIIQTHSRPNGSIRIYTDSLLGLYPHQNLTLICQFRWCIKYLCDGKLLITKHKTASLCCLTFIHPGRLYWEQCFLFPSWSQSWYFSFVKTSSLDAFSSLHLNYVKSIWFMASQLDNGPAHLRDELTPQTKFYYNSYVWSHILPVKLTF